MNKMMRMGVYYFLFSFVILMGMLQFYPYLTNLSFVPDTFPSYLYDFDTRLRRFQEARPPRIVIVGACFAMWLGEDERIHNLGLAGALPGEETKIIERYLVPDDLAIFVFTLRDVVVSSSYRPRPVVYSSIRRKLYLIQQALTAGLYPTEPTPPITMSDSEREIIRYVCGDSGSVKPEYLYGYVNEYSNPTYHVSITALQEVYRMHPNTIFILNPNLSLKPYPTDSILSSKINRIIECEYLAKKSIFASGLQIHPVPANTLSNDDFVDYLHPTRLGNDKIARYLVRNLFYRPVARGGL